MRYRFAPEVRTIAERLISEQVRHSHLCALRMNYQFRENAQEKGGRLIWGTTKPLTGMEAMRVFGALQKAAERDEKDREFDDQFPGTWVDESEWQGFQITIAHDIWKSLPDDAWRIWLVNHELCHCGIKEDKEGERKVTSLPHDIELFYCDAGDPAIPDLEPAAFRTIFCEIEATTLLVDSKRDKDTGQTSLELVGGGGADVEVRTGTDSVTFTPESAARVVANIDRHLRGRGRSTKGGGI